MILWDQAVEIINCRELARLVRSEKQINEYRAAKERFEKEYGGTAEFVVKERLKWTGDALQASGDAFLQNWSDIKILVNDFSYDFEPGVRHCVVWLKTPIPCSSDEFPTKEAAAAIEQWLHEHFVQRCSIPRANIAWFKNTSALQSIPSVSHFHVLVRDCTPELEQKILTAPKDS